MINVKATTTDDGVTNMEISVEANPIEYMAEVVSVIESLMRGLKENDIMLHAAVLKVIANNPQILLGGDEILLGGDEMAEVALARIMSKAIIEKGVN